MGGVTDGAYFACTSIQVEISNSPRDNDLVIVYTHVAHDTGFLSAKASNASSLQVGEEKGQQNMLCSRWMHGNITCMTLMPRLQYPRHWEQPMPVTFGLERRISPITQKQQFKQDVVSSLLPAATVLTLSGVR